MTRYISGQVENFRFNWQFAFDEWSQGPLIKLEHSDSDLPEATGYVKHFRQLERTSIYVQNKHN